jgi:hypothetical protein
VKIKTLSHTITPVSDPLIFQPIIVMENQSHGIVDGIPSIKKEK